MYSAVATILLGVNMFFDLVSEEFAGWFVTVVQFEITFTNLREKYVLYCSLFTVWEDDSEVTLKMTVAFSMEIVK